MTIQLFDEFATRPYRSQQIYQILISLAYNRQSITYLGLAGILGYDGAGVFSQMLDAILGWCNDNELPPLTVLVVNSETGEPGVGFKTLEDLGRDRERVYNYNWYGLVPPTSADFGG